MKFPAELNTLLDENPLLKAYIFSIEEAFAKLTSINQDLSEQLAFLKRQIFGQKSERFIAPDPLQTTLDLDIAPQPIPEATTVEVPSHERTVCKNKNHPGRDEIPAHIERVIIEVKPEFDTTDMEQIGEKIVERLEYTPPKFFVKQYVSPVFRKIKNGLPTLVNTPSPVLCIDKGKLGASMVAHLLLSKCEDHLPIYRIAKMIARDANFEVAESTLRDAFRRGAELIEAIVHRMRQIMLAGNYLQVDESTIKVVIEPSQGKSHQGYMIVSHAPPDKIIVFDYKKTRNVKLISELLGDFSGTLQTDGLELYTIICKEKKLHHAGCMDHARRMFEKALDTNKAMSETALSMLQKLYAVEREAREGCLTNESRHLLRQEKSRAIFDAFIAWCKEIRLQNIAPQSLFTKALDYTLNRIGELGAFLDDGKLEMSNALIENGIRPLAIGRKNFMITGSEAAAKRLATVYSLAGTCALNDINFRDYLCFILDELPKRSANNIDDLLPWNWKSSL